MSNIITNIAERFRMARQKKRDEHLSAETNKLGNLRAGATGMMSETGEVAGACHRKSHLRSLGLEVDPPTDDKYIMFELGYANEDEIYKQLQATLAPGEIILREEEIPIEWRTSNGTKVTGRPDMVICRKLEVDWETIPSKVAFVKDIIPVLGLELKSIHSLWSARDVIFGKKPKMDNLLQAAHYMWKLDVPYKIIYKSYSQLGQGMAGNEWIIKQFPRIGEPGSEFIEYNEKKGTIKHIKQFEVIFDLRFDDKGRLQYKEEAATDWITTLITTKYIENYFEFTSKIATSGNLGPRPITIDAHGNKLGYSSCDYCPLKKTCDESDKSKSTYKEWLQKVKDLVDK